MMICLIESPYQAFVLDQMIHNEIIKEKELIVFVNDKNLENGSFLESIINKLSFKNLHIKIIKKSLFSFQNLAYLFFKGIFSKKIVIGDILSPWMSSFARYMNFDEVYLLEDGTSQFVDNSEIEECIKSFKKVKRFSLISDESILKDAKTKIIKIDIRVLNSDNKVPEFVKVIEQNPDLPLFFGAPIVSFNEYHQDKYNNICLDALGTDMKKNQISAIYLQHRREIANMLPENFIKLVSGGLDFAFLKLDSDIRTKVLNQKKIVSFASTSLCILARSGLLRNIDKIIIIQVCDLGYRFQQRHNNLVDFVSKILEEEGVSVSVFKTSSS